jgi:hypothetical protein
MMTGRIDPFASLTAPPVFATKPKKPEPKETKADAERIAQANNFPSRQAPRVVREPKRKPRYHTTGRNRQLNVKVTTETVERVYRMADDRRVPLGELLELALDALDRNPVPAKP